MASGAARLSGWEQVPDPGENVLWQGRPEQGVAWDRFDTRQTLFGIAVIVFAVIWTGGVLRAGPAGLPGMLLPFAGVFFFGLGAYRAGGYLFWDAYRRGQSWYSLTTRRAIIATELFGRRRMQSYPITLETPLNLVDGEPGDIFFATAFRQGKDGTRKQRIGFERLGNAREVYDLMRTVQRGSLDDRDG